MRTCQLVPLTGHPLINLIPDFVAQQSLQMRNSVSLIQVSVLARKIFGKNANLKCWYISASLLSHCVIPENREEKITVSS